MASNNRNYNATVLLTQFHDGTLSPGSGDSSETDTDTKSTFGKSTTIGKNKLGKGTFGKLKPSSSKIGRCENCSTSFTLYQQKEDLLRLSLKERLAALKDDPLSIAEVPPQLCARCRECKCAKNPQNYMRNQVLQDMIENKYRFVKSKTGNRW